MLQSSTPKKPYYKTIRTYLRTLTGMSSKNTKNATSIHFQSQDENQIKQLTLCLDMLGIAYKGRKQITIEFEHFSDIQKLFLNTELNFESLGKVFPQTMPSRRGNTIPEKAPSTRTMSIKTSLQKEVEEITGPAFNAARHQLFFLMHHFPEKKKGSIAGEKIAKDFKGGLHLRFNFNNRSEMKKATKLFKKKNIMHYPRFKTNCIIVSPEDFEEIARAFFKKFRLPVFKNSDDLKNIPKDHEDKFYKIPRKQLFLLTGYQPEWCYGFIIENKQGLHLRFTFRTESLMEYVSQLLNHYEIEHNFASKGKNSLLIIPTDSFSKISEVYFKIFPFFRKEELAPAVEEEVSSGEEDFWIEEETPPKKVLPLEQLFNELELGQNQNDPYTPGFNAHSSSKIPTISQGSRTTILKKLTTLK